MEQEKIETKPKKIKEADLPPSVLKKQKRRKGAIRRLFIFLILIALAATIFWFGWIHPDLKPNQFAVIQNKITKSTTLYDNSKFCWNYFALIPTNVTVSVYDNSPRAITIKRHGTLPSGKFYSRYISPNDPSNFDYAIDMQVIYQLKEEALLDLVKSGVLTPITNKNNTTNITSSQSLESYIASNEEVKTVNQNEQESQNTPESSNNQDVEPNQNNENTSTNTKRAKTPQGAQPPLINTTPKDFHQNYAANLTTALYAYLTKRSSEMEFVTRLALDNNAIQEELSQFIQSVNPNVELIATIVNQISIPDYELYQQVKNMIKDEFKPTSDSSELQQQMIKDEQAKIYNMNKIEALQELGKVLTTYPVLMDYLKTYASSDKDMELLKLPK